MQKNATSYCWDKYAEYTGICQKKHAHDQQKNTWSKNNDRILEQMQCRLCILPFLEVTMLFNLHVILVGNTVGKSPTGILSLFI